MTAPLCRLDDRAVLAVSGGDRFDFLNTLLSADVVADAGGAAFAALLTPQGKLLADVLCYTDSDRILIDFPTGSDFDKRLRLYKLRQRWTFSCWMTGQLVWFCRRPRLPSSGCEQGPQSRIMATTGPVWRQITVQWLPIPGPIAWMAGAGPRFERWVDDRRDYDRARIAAVVPEGPLDLKPNKALLMESGFERLGDWTSGKGVTSGRKSQHG